MKNTKTIAVIGLGYVGLPLAAELGKKYKTIGIDINQKRIEELKTYFDRTREVDEEGLKSATSLSYSADIQDAKEAQIYIVTVPTPVDHYNNPDLTPVKKATESVAKVLKKGDIVVYESTVYPGVTEEICAPLLEELSGLKFNQDFFCGYSPERINPGDKERTISKILKVTSGSTPEVAEEIDQLYASIITAGTFKAAGIKVAEAAKVIENAQRDINIAFVNELAKIFNKLDIDTKEVLEAAGTKWNFLKFQPGLVGGHCIGVDPFYIAQKAKEVGYNPEIILAGRRLNDSMGAYVANQFVKLLIREERKIKNSRALIMGITFKENCPDIRNSRVIDIIKELKTFGLEVSVYDPWADPKEVKQEYGIELLTEKPDLADYCGTLVTVGHEEFRSFNPKGHLVYDVKGIFDKNEVAGRL